MTCRVLRIDEQLYGCEELPAVDAGEVFYLRFYFGQSGMELDAVSLDLLS